MHTTILDKEFIPTNIHRLWSKGVELGRAPPIASRRSVTLVVGSENVRCDSGIVWINFGGTATHFFHTKRQLARDSACTGCELCHVRV